MNPSLATSLAPSTVVLYPVESLVLSQVMFQVLLLAWALVLFQVLNQGQIQVLSLSHNQVCCQVWLQALLKV